MSDGCNCKKECHLKAYIYTYACEGGPLAGISDAGFKRCDA